MAYSMHIVMLMASNIVKVLANECPIDGGNSQQMLMEPREITVMVWTNWNVRGTWNVTWTIGLLMNILAFLFNDLEKTVTNPNLDLWKSVSQVKVCLSCALALSCFCRCLFRGNDGFQLLYWLCACVSCERNMNLCYCFHLLLEQHTEIIRNIQNM